MTENLEYHVYSDGKFYRTYKYLDKATRSATFLIDMKWAKKTEVFIQRGRQPKQLIETYS